MNHPLEVVYPHAGIRYLLKWYSYNEGDCIAIAVSEKALMHVAERLVERFSLTRQFEQLSFQELLKIEMVSPSEAACVEASKEKLEEDADFFFTEVVSHLSSLLSSSNKLPKQFKYCQNIPKNGEDHFYCYGPDDKEICRATKNGEVGIEIPLDKVSFYNTYYAVWREKFPSRKYVDKSLSYSKAPQVKEDEVIWVASTSNSGVLLVQKAPGESLYNHNTYFYFKKLADLDVKPYNDMHVVKQAIAHKVKQENFLAVKKKLELEKQKEIDNILSIFGTD